ncbi:MAG: 30S ribosomal protein S13 [Candidatus Anstonellales archaeon]
MVKKSDSKPEQKEKEQKEASKKEKAEKHAKAPVKKRADDPDFRGIIRVGNVDVDGELPLWKGLSKVYGIGYNTSFYLSKVLKNKLNLDPYRKVGYLNEEEVEKVDKVLASIGDNLPPYLLNRRKDFETGEDKHLTGDDLIFSIRQDIEREKNEYTWRGYRHAHGQKVRGQRTKNTGRKGGAVGVLKGTIKAAQSAAAGKPSGPASGSSAAPAKQAEKKV